MKFMMRHSANPPPKCKSQNHPGARLLRRCSRERLDASEMSICSSVCLPCVCRQNAYKNAIFSKTKQLRAMISIDDLQWIGSPTWDIQGSHYWIPEIQDGGDLLSWKSWNCHISTKNHQISIKFGTQMQIWNSVTVRWPNIIFFLNWR